MGVDFLHKFLSKEQFMQTQNDRSQLWRTVALLAIGLLAGSTIFQITPASAQKEVKVKQIDENLYMGVRLGMMVPYFGKTLPDGFVWADGQATWPDASWVPEGLRGTKVPDMRGELIGGAKTEGDIARVYKDGKLTFKVQGSDFALPAGENVSGNLYEDMVKWVRGGTVPGSFKTDGPPAQIKFVNVTSSYLKYSGKLTGDKTVTLDLGQVEQNPRHLMCRWIIRIE